MKSLPIGRRTRRQLAIKEKELRQEVKRRWFAARTTWRNRLRRGVKLEVFHDDDDHSHTEAHHLYYKVADDVGRNDGDNDDSLKLIGERWNPDHGYDSHSSATSYGSDAQQLVAVGASTLHRGNDATQGNDKNDDHIGVSNDANGKKRVRVSNAGMFRKFEGLVLAKELKHNAPQNYFVSRRTRYHLRSKLHRKKRRYGTFGCPTVIDDGTLSSSSDCDKDDGREIASIRRRGRPFRTTYVENEPEPSNDYDSDFEPETDTKLEDTKCCPLTGIRKRGRPRKMIYVETKSEPRNDSDPEPETCTKLENNHMLEDTKSREIACIKTSGRLQGCTNVENTSNPETATKLENDTGGDNAGILGKRKRGRPPKNRNAEEDPRTNRKPNTIELGNVTPSTLLDKGSTGLDTPVSSVSDAHLPLKFSFRVQNLSSDMSSEEEDIEGLFCRLDVSLRLSDVSSIISDSDEDEDDDDDVPSYESVVVQGQLCRQGKHYLILDDEIGIRCQSCSFVKLEIRDVTPDFYDNPFGKSGNKNYNRCISYNDYEAGGSDRFRLPGFSHNLENVHSENFRGTM